MAGHPIDIQTLLAFAAGDLTAAAAAPVAAHLVSCARCAATVGRYRAVRAAGRADQSEAPPADTLARARALFAERRATARPAPGWHDALPRLVAALTFDSRTAWAGARGGVGGYQLGWECDRADIDLHLAREGRDWHLLGQVMAHDEGALPLTVALLPIATADTEAARLATPTDARGRFTLRAAPGRYDLHVMLPDAHIVLPHLDLEA